jgi:hypothetical protein
MHEKTPLLLTGGLLLAGMASCVNAANLLAIPKALRSFAWKKPGAVSMRSHIVYSQVKHRRRSSAAYVFTGTA